MNAKNIYSATYRHDYFEGYSSGMNPSFDVNSYKKEGAFYFGFLSGRMDYEDMNGAIKEGIPQYIVSIKILEDFLLSGLLGLNIDIEGFTNFQIDVIRKWYLSGVEKYVPNESIYLDRILKANDINLYDKFL